MTGFRDIEIKAERRLCKVNGKLGYFHCWEHYSRPVEADITIGGRPAGVISFVRGLVEFPEGMGYASPADIKFCDEENAMLCMMDKHEKENNHAEN